jgi:hypothetical protein
MVAEAKDSGELRGGTRAGELRGVEAIIPDLNGGVNQPCICLAGSTVNKPAFPFAANMYLSATLPHRVD